MTGLVTFFSETCCSATAHCLQGQFEHCVVVFYKALVLGVRSQRPDLIAVTTALVGASGQRYREMLAETNGRLAKDHYSRELARVRPANPGSTI